MVRQERKGEMEMNTNKVIMEKLVKDLQGEIFFYDNKDNKEIISKAVELLKQIKEEK